MRFGMRAIRSALIPAAAGLTSDVRKSAAVSVNPTQAMTNKSVRIISKDATHPTPVGANPRGHGGIFVVNESIDCDLCGRGGIPRDGRGRAGGLLAFR
jgi:hypothetical protein